MIGGPILPRYLCRKLSIPLREYARAVLLPIGLILVGNLLLLSALNALFPRDGYIPLLLKASAAGTLGGWIGLWFAD